jgi:hypothetical protein
MLLLVPQVLLNIASHKATTPFLAKRISAILDFMAKAQQNGSTYKQ